MVIFVQPRPGDPVEDISTNSRCRHFYKVTTKINHGVYGYVNMCIVWPSEHTLLIYALLDLGKTVTSIIAEIYFPVVNCHTENKWIILPQKGFINNVIMV